MKRSEENGWGGVVRFNPVPDPAPVVAEVRRAPLDLQRYGVLWRGKENPICEPLDDGYWTPWHMAQAEVERLSASLEALRTRLRGLEQQWRCDEISHSISSRSCADELARLLTTPEEPGT